MGAGWCEVGWAWWGSEGAVNPHQHRAAHAGLRLAGTRGWGGGGEAGTHKTSPSLGRPVCLEPGSLRLEKTGRKVQLPLEGVLEHLLRTKIWLCYAEVLFPETVALEPSPPSVSE